MKILKRLILRNFVAKKSKAQLAKVSGIIAVIECTKNKHFNDSITCTVQLHETITVN